ncbi:Ycf48-like protein [bacterium HR36]|nr:Ycf48-like protein [bacterium HR36]
MRQVRGGWDERTDADKGRTWWRAWKSGGGFTAACALSILGLVWIGWADVASPERYTIDAAIRALWFADEQEGWAVGDEGLILHTIDGGRTWERQASGTRANLRGVHFLSPFKGYAVGEAALLESPLTMGVLLMTRDGGVTWRTVSDREMPGLHHVHFFDQRQGVVAGDASEGFPSGLWTTEDGGLSWRAIPHSRQPGWYAAAWLGPDLGVCVGRWGKVAVLRQGTWQPVTGEWSAHRAVRGVCWNGKTAWACGDAGLLLRCDDPQLRRWQRVSLPVPEEWQRLWDFHAVHFVGEFGWVAGRPGSVVLYTWDNGQNWQVQVTPQSLPIYTLYFVNERCGWAGGAGGTILHTRDGGKTWQLQRRDVHRAAALIITARAESLPCELLANLAADQGYYTVAARVFGEDAESEPEDAASQAERFHSAVRQLGGIEGETLCGGCIPTTSWFTSTEQLAHHLCGGSARGLERLQRQLVLTLRLWRPDVILTDHPDPRRPNGVEGALTAWAVTKAFRLAENADAFPEQLSHFRLEPWSAAKLYALWDAPEGATLAADWNAVRPNLGMTIWEAAWPGRHLLAPMPNYRGASAQSFSQRRIQYFRLLDSRLPDAQKHRALMEGIHAPAGGPNRRMPQAIAVAETELERAAQRARTMEETFALTERMLATPAAAERWLAELPDHLRLLAEPERTEVYWQVAQQLQRQGQWGLAHQALVSLLENQPDSPLAPPAAQWLAAFLASSEARRRAELRQFVCQVTGPDHTADTATPRPRPKPAKPAAPDNKPTILQSRRNEWHQWQRGALLAGDVLAAYGPRWWLDPRVQFCVLAAQRHLGRSEDTLLAYTRFHRNWMRGPWYEATAAELSFLQTVRGGLPNAPETASNLVNRKRSILCPWTNQPPYLDGQLDDACWQASAPLVLRNAIAQTCDAFPTEARLAYDQRFLYIALRCGHPAGHQREPVRPRRCDEDLRAYDRVSLLLDVDRDYVTCYHFQVDQRGCVYEECWADATWNPQWYVASRSTPTAWEAELAIPWSELVREPPDPRQVWAMNLVRIIPNRGVQALCLPAGVRPRPEGMGLLGFGNRN